jgi:TPP-dependent pyruvate/acetoin dehydrogenase alpha subunit
MIKDMEENHNWKFIYLAANQDAFQVGMDMGMRADCCSNYRCEPGEMIGATREMSKAVSSYRTRSATDGKEAQFTLEN